MDDLDEIQSTFDKKRVKTSIRLNYEAQVEVIKKQVGSLEDIRDRLQLSQRKMAQLLLVDPSAWSRWIADGDSAPPHIYRALQWYLALIEKIPGLSPAYFLQKDTQALKKEFIQIAKNEISPVTKTIEELSHKANKIVEFSSKDFNKLEEEVSTLRRLIHESNLKLNSSLMEQKKIKQRYAIGLFFYTLVLALMLGVWMINLK